MPALQEKESINLFSITKLARLHVDVVLRITDLISGLNGLTHSITGGWVNFRFSGFTFFFYWNPKSHQPEPGARGILLEFLTQKSVLDTQIELSSQYFQPQNALPQLSQFQKYNLEEPLL